MSENTGLSAGRPRGRPPKSATAPKIALPPIPEQETAVADRPNLRAPVREENMSSVDRAKKRAAELRGHIGSLDEGVDKYFIDANMIPEGWTYEWKRRLLMGQEDPSYAVNLARMGWEAVPVSRHPFMMPADWKGGTIERDGMVLMERPAEVVDEARAIERKRARDQVRAKEAQLSGTPEGTMTRDHEKVRPSIKKSYENIPIPKE